MEQAKSWKPKFESLGNLIKAVLDLTKCIVDIKSLRSQYINLDTPEMVISSAHIPIAVYWTIISIVACASMVIDLPGSSHEYIFSAFFINYICCNLVMHVKSVKILMLMFD